MQLRTHHHATINAPPGQRKRFDVEHMRRIPAQLTDEARYFLMVSNHQSRVIPQSLSEFFGTLPDVDHIEVSIEENKDRIIIDVKHCFDEEKHHRFFVNIDDIHQVSGHPNIGFKAAKMADELLRSYRLHVLKEGN